MVDSATLKTLKDIDILTVDTDALVDIRDVQINTDLPSSERMLDFIKQIKNPYCYKCGKAVVKVSFAETETTLEDLLESYLLSL